MYKLKNKTKIILIIILIISLPICIFNSLMLIQNIQEQKENNISDEFYVEASEYLREELQLQGEITDKTKIVAIQAKYFYGDETVSGEKKLQSVEVKLKLGDNSLELFFNVKEYVVTFNLDEYENMNIIGYQKIN